MSVAARLAASMRSVVKVALALSLGAALLIGRAACTSAPPAQAPVAVGAASPVGAEPERAQGDGAEPPDPEQSASRPDAGRTGPRAKPSDAQDAPLGGAPGKTASASGSGVAGLLSRSDPRALALLSSVERELHRDPPAQVHELIARYRGGAGRDQLRAYVREDFPDDLPLRVLGLRWIDSAFPDPARPETEPKPPATGSPPRWIEPIQKR